MTMPCLKAADYTWTDGTGSGFFTDGGNWAGGVAPWSDPEASLYFQAGGTAYNDMPSLVAQRLIFGGDGSVVTSNSISGVWQVNFGDSGAPGTNTVDVELRASAFGFSASAYAGQHLRFTQEVDMWTTPYLFFNGSGLDSSVSFAGANGVLRAGVPVTAQVLGATLQFDNTSVANNSRWAAFSQLNLRTSGRVQLIGNEIEGVAQYLGSVKSYTSDILEVRNVGSTSATALEIGVMELTEGAVLLHRSTGGMNQILGSLQGPKIFYDGQGATDFLGPQMFYLSGDLEGGNAVVEYAAYDATTGVISATTDYDNVETVNDVNANVLQTTTSDFFSGTSTMHSLAYNAGSLYNGGEGVFNLQHLLMGPTAGALGVALNFGASEGSITADTWGSRVSQEAYLTGDIQGSNELTFRGTAYFHLMSESSFSGTVKFAGVRAGLEFSGQMANVAAVEIGDEGRETQLALHAGADRLADDAEILVTGDGSLTAYSEPGTGPWSETIGDITVAMQHEEVFNNKRFNLMVRNYGVDDPTSPMALTASSLTFAETAVGNRVDLIVEGTGGSLTIEGGPVVLKNANQLNVEFKTAGSRITLAGGVSIGSGEDGTVGLNAGYDLPEEYQATLEADLNLQDGTLNLLSEQGLLALEGDLTMGQMLEINLALNEANDTVALIAIDGNLTLDGTLFVVSNFGYVEGTWLLFSVTGTILDEDWSIQGLDGTYNYYTQGGNVYLTTDAVPEPSTWMLLGLGAAVVGLRVMHARRARF